MYHIKKNLLVIIAKSKLVCSFCFLANGITLKVKIIYSKQDEDIKSVATNSQLPEINALSFTIKKRRKTLRNNFFEDAKYSDALCA
eukprot:snap_masked-scaffold_10-processed-gene-2.20-mRNA-1 protein AED:1.00 eAED:1.00 QI:0/0/0/0/1/1/2/0/85